MNFFDPPQRSTLVIMTDQKALKKLCSTLKFTFLTDKGLLEDFSLCGVVWVRCLTSLRRWLSPRPLLLGERRCCAESAHDSSFGRFSTKFRVQYFLQYNKKQTINLIIKYHFSTHKGILDHMGIFEYWRQTSRYIQSYSPSLYSYSDIHSGGFSAPRNKIGNFHFRLDQGMTQQVH